MEIEIEVDLNKKDEIHLMGWSEQVFPIEGKGLCWCATPMHVVARKNGEPVSHLGFGEFLIHSESESFRVVGVGGVVVLPEHQGQHIPAALFSRLHSSDFALKISHIFTLFCPRRLVAYYERLGYTLYEGTLSFLQSGRQVESSFCFMYRGKCNLGSKVIVPSNPW
jgi:GNAT superfamily N-acetyltransferase